MLGHASARYGEVTVKSIEFDLVKGRDPIGSPVSTKTWAVTGSVNRAAGITAVSCELLTKVVDKKVSFPFTDQTTSLLL
jgi:hypothetical protein